MYNFRLEVPYEQEWFLPEMMTPAIWKYLLKWYLGITEIMKVAIYFSSKNFVAKLSNKDHILGLEWRGREIVPGHW